MQDVIALLTRLSTASTAWFSVVSTVAWLVGAWLVVTSVKRASDVSERGDQGGGRSWGGVSARFLTGVLLFSLPVLIQTTGISLFGDSVSSDVDDIFKLSSTTGAVFTDANAKLGLELALAFVQAVGLTGVVKGVYKLNKAVEEPGREHFGSGITHIIAGTCAWYIAPFVGLVDSFLFGGN